MKATVRDEELSFFQHACCVAGYNADEFEVAAIDDCQTDPMYIERTVTVTRRRQQAATSLVFPAWDGQPFWASAAAHAVVRGDFGMV